MSLALAIVPPLDMNLVVAQPNHERSGTVGQNAAADEPEDNHIFSSRAASRSPGMFHLKVRRNRRVKT